MFSTLRGSWNRFRIRIAHLTAGGSWAVQLSDSTQRNLRYFFFDGLFASANDSITLTYLSLFVLSLGASSSDIGLMTALASLSATILLIPGAMLATSALLPSVVMSSCLMIGDDCDGCAPPVSSRNTRGFSAILASFPKWLRLTLFS